jgi:hypothetical protein
MSDLRLENIELHKQNVWNSCVPMSVELVLKLIGLLDPAVTPLQDDPKKIGTSDWIKRPQFKFPHENPKIIFDREYLNVDKNEPDHTDEALQKNLEPTLKTIDTELQSGRYPIISVRTSSDDSTHNIVVYGKIDDDNYKTITFHYQSGVLNQPENLRQKIIERKGTDLITYKFL